MSRSFRDRWSVVGGRYPNFVGSFATKLPTKMRCLCVACLGGTIHHHRQPAFWAALLLCAGTAAAVAGLPPPPVELGLEWTTNVPCILVTVTAPTNAADLREITVPVELMGASNRLYWSGKVKVAFDAQRVGRGQALPRLPEKPDAPYRVEMKLAEPVCGIRAWEDLVFRNAQDVVRRHGLRIFGRHPDTRIEVVLELNASSRFVELEATVLDRDLNQVLRKVQRYRPDQAARVERLDVTPQARAAGPFLLVYQVTDEEGAVLCRREVRFACPNAVIPLSSMQTDRLLDWYLAPARSPEDVGFGGNYVSTPFSAKHDVLRPLFDETVFHSSGRSLRMDYRAGVRTHVFSNLELPGFPVRAYIWVKGNKSGDTLTVTFRDMIELAAKQWERHVHRTGAAVCTLDFDDWRRFEVPVLGDGLQEENRSVNAAAIALPIYLLAFSVESRAAKGAPAEERTVWLDDLAVETQVAMNERVAMELRADTPDAQLRPDGKIMVGIGNGTGARFTDGKLQFTARDRRGNDVLEMSLDVTAESEAFACAEIPMARVAAARPEGPVTVEMTLLAPSAGLRVRRSLMLKADRHAAVFWDFEDRQNYNNSDLQGDGKTRGVGGRPVSGGAEGTGQALAVKAPTNAVNHLILHPSLPGIPARVELMVKGGAAPVRLKPQFLDAGRTGVTELPFNRFPIPEILVDWQDWRRVSFAAPAVPPAYDDGARSFLMEPAYPLNLVLSVCAAGAEPAELLVDRVTVHTHLDDAESVTVNVAYPDEKKIIPPDAPLTLAIRNWQAETLKRSARMRLLDIHGRLAFEESRTLDLPAGQTVLPVFVPRLSRGLYNLEVTGIATNPMRELVVCVDTAAYFGPDADARLADIPALERQLGMVTRRLYFDWDSSEHVPGLWHYQWFHNKIDAASDGGMYRIAPVLGFSADWAGPEKWEEVLRKEYMRFIGNHAQVPVRMTDWSLYVREAVREFAPRVSAWEFWENPDRRGAASYVPPEKYRDMISIVRKWVDVYDPNTPVIAAGFSADSVYGYLQSFPEPHKLPFDYLGVVFNIGELSPEAADMEGLLDDLDNLLELSATQRGLDVSQLDWPVGDLVSTMLQGAYHARASLIMNRNIREPHRFKLINDGASLEGYGVFYRASYGNSPNVQGLRPIYFPKPAYFAIVSTRRMLEGSRFEGAVQAPDRDPEANCAYIYKKPGGTRLAALWRARGEPRVYRTPAAWKNATAMDAFGTPIPLSDTVRFSPVPLFVTFPPDCAAAQIRHDLRTLESADGRDRILLALMTAEPDSAARAEYRATGAKPEPAVRRGRRLIGGSPVESTFLDGISQEDFSFTAEQAKACRLTRTWFCEDGQTGSVLAVSLNGGAAQKWDLSFSETGRNLKQAGIRESSLLVTGVAAGENRLSIRHERPGSTSCWRVSPLGSEPVDLACWDPINAAQPKGFPLAARSAIGTPLRIGERAFATGIGTLSPAYLEYPVDGRFARFEVTVGVDAAARGRGSMVFSVFGDGRLLATSGPMTGFSPPKTLLVERLDTVARLSLRVVNAEKETTDGLADWVDAKLYPK